MNNMTPAEKLLTRAKCNIVLSYPFWATLIGRLPLQEDYTCTTGWTDSEVVGYNPDWVMTLSSDEIEFFLIHEFAHVALGHCHRIEQRDANYWNEACDYAANNLIKQSGAFVPAWAYCDKYVGDFAERIYEKVYKDKPKSSGNSGGNQKSGASTNSGNSEKIGNDVRPWPGDNKGQAPSEADIRAKESEWKSHLASAMSIAKKSGSTPETMDCVISHQLEPKVPWQEVLQEYVSRVARNDYSFSKPNRKRSGGDFLFPSLYNLEVPPIGVAFDVSGSISQKDFDQAGAEFTDIILHYGTTLHACYFSTSVSNPQEYTREDCPITLIGKGKGGTRVAGVFEHFKKIEDLGALVVFTDMEIPDIPKANPLECDVLWIQLSGGPKKAPFGKVVQLVR